jgi:hypothetical protein
MKKKTSILYIDFAITYGLYVNGLQLPAHYF